MRPEDIDKLFKERLGNTSPTPPGDLWNHLQDRMEAEMPQKAPLQPKEEKRSYMWIYSSVAATISLVLTAGVVFFNIESGTPEVNQALADKGRVELYEAPVSSQPALGAMAQAEVTTDNNIEQKKLTPQATDANSIASNSTEEVVKTEAIAKAVPKAVQRESAAKATALKQPLATVQQAIATTVTPTEEVAEAAEAVTVPAVKPVMPSALAVANLNAAPVEIIIKRAGSSQTATAMAEAAGDSDGSDKRTKLAKNIFKQVRNLASGEDVELSELGINADKVALNTQIGKQKFSKVINL